MVLWMDGMARRAVNPEKFPISEFRAERKGCDRPECKEFILLRRMELLAARDRYIGCGVLSWNGFAPLPTNPLPACAVSPRDKLLHPQHELQIEYASPRKSTKAYGWIAMIGMVAMHRSFS